MEMVEIYENYFINYEHIVALDISGDEDEVTIYMVNGDCHNVIEEYASHLLSFLFDEQDIEESEEEEEEEEENEDGTLCPCPDCFVARLEAGYAQEAEDESEDEDSDDEGAVIELEISGDSEQVAAFLKKLGLF